MYKTKENNKNKKHWTGLKKAKLRIQDIFWETVTTNKEE